MESKKSPTKQQPKQASIDVEPAKLPNKTFVAVVAKMQSQLRSKQFSTDEKEAISARLKEYQALV